MILRSVHTTLLTLLFEERQLIKFMQIFEKHLLIIIFFVLLILFYCYIRLQNSNAVPSLENAQKRKARYPYPHQKLLYKTPPSDCVVLGKWKKQYVCKELTQDGHVLVVGGSGSGKSSAIAIPTLLTNEKASCFAIDIKGELSKKASNLSDEKNVVFNPKDKSSYGYDPFWCLDNNGTSNKQMVYETMEQVVFSLLPMSNTESNPYWTVTGRALLLGLMLYEYRAGYYNLIDIIDQIQSQPIEDLLEGAEEILEDDSMEYRMLSQFFGLADTTLSCIYSTAMQKLTVFTADEDIRYAFRDNPRKMNPFMLEDGKNIFLSIPEEYLEKYATILHLVINQSFYVLSKRSEDAHPICYMIDELPRIMSCGRIASLLDAARTLRSRRVTLFLVVQSLEALEIAFSSKEATDLVSNCLYTVVLSASSEETIRKVRAWAGRYMAPQYSYNGTGTDAKMSIAYSEKDIVDSRDLMMLVQSGEAIVLTPYGYCRIKKASYYSDTYFQPMHQKVLVHNLHLPKKGVIDTTQTEEKNTPLITETMKESLIEWEESIITFEDLDFDKLENHTT